MDGHRVFDSDPIDHRRRHDMQRSPGRTRRGRSSGARLASCQCVQTEPMIFLLERGGGPRSHLAVAFWRAAPAPSPVRWSRGTGEVALPFGGRLMLHAHPPRSGVPARPGGEGLAGLSTHDSQFSLLTGAPTSPTSTTLSRLPRVENQNVPRCTFLSETFVAGVCGTNSCS